MSFRKLTQEEEKEIQHYFFSHGFDAVVAAERIVYTEVVAESEMKPVIDVFRSMTMPKRD